MPRTPIPRWRLGNYQRNGRLHKVLDRPAKARNVNIEPEDLPNYPPNQWLTGRLPRVGTPEFPSCSARGAKTSPFFSTHPLLNTPVATPRRSWVRRCKFTRPYPNFLFLIPRGTPSFTPAVLCNYPASNCSTNGDVAVQNVFVPNCFWSHSRPKRVLAV